MGNEYNSTPDLSQSLYISVGKSVLSRLTKQEGVGGGGAVVF